MLLFPQIMLPHALHLIGWKPVWRRGSSRKGCCRPVAMSPPPLRPGVLPPGVLGETSWKIGLKTRTSLGARRYFQLSVSGIGMLTRTPFLCLSIWGGSRGRACRAAAFCFLFLPCLHFLGIVEDASTSLVLTSHALHVAGAACLLYAMLCSPCSSLDAWSPSFRKGLDQMWV